MRVADVEAAIGQLGATPEVIRALAAPLADDLLAEAPVAGEWSILQVIAHLVHADEFAFVARVRSISGGAAEIERYHPVDEIGIDGTPREVLHELLDRLAAGRADAAVLLRSIDPADLDRSAGHPGGSFTAADFVEEWVFHDADHLQQILENVKGRQFGRVGPAMQRALRSMTSVGPQHEVAD